MTTFKIQRIRSCTQCKSILPVKCEKCVSHPERKPTVVELYDWPEILETGPCWCCIRIRCQLSGCTNTPWKYVKLRSRTGKTTAKSLFCSHTCSAKAAGATRANSVKLPCSYCSKPVSKRPSILKLRRDVYCNHECHYLNVKKQTFELKQAKKLAEKVILEADENKALLDCIKCKSVTEHIEESKNQYRCLECKAITNGLIEVPAVR